MANIPLIKIYKSYSNNGYVLVMGQVFSVSKEDLSKEQEPVKNNVLALLDLFRRKTIPNVALKLVCQGEEFLTVSEQDGFFKFEFYTKKNTPIGWKEIAVFMLDDLGVVQTAATGELFFPPKTKYVFVSDIDDTIMKSYSATIFRRLYEMVSKSPAKRRLFENISKFYNALAESNTMNNEFHPFFYVSSSEWNLYDYLDLIFNQHQLPKGVFLLNSFRTLSSFLYTGKKGHEGKLIRIAGIIKAFPDAEFVLLGDNSQKDTEIYTAIVEQYPDRIAHVMIRNVLPEQQHITRSFLKNIEFLNVSTCLFNTTQDAIAYARASGLIHDRD